MEWLTDQKNYQSFWSSIPKMGCVEKGKTQVWGIRPLWIDVEHALNETCRELFIEDADFYIRVTVDDDKMHYETKDQQSAHRLKKNTARTCQPQRIWCTYCLLHRIRVAHRYSVGAVKWWYYRNSNGEVNKNAAVTYEWAEWSTNVGQHPVLHGLGLLVAVIVVHLFHSLWSRCARHNKTLPYVSLHIWTKVSSKWYTKIDWYSWF